MKNYLLNLLALMLIIASCSSLPDKEGEEESSCDIPETVSYEKHIVPVLEANCYKCHNDEDYASKADGNKMEGYENIKALVDKGLVYGNITHKPGFINMPYQEKQIDTCDIKLIKSWIDNDAPNN